VNGEFDADLVFGGPGDDFMGAGFNRLNGQAGVDSCANGEVLVSCEASAAAASDGSSLRAVGHILVIESNSLKGVDCPSHRRFVTSGDRNGFISAAAVALMRARVP